MTEGSFHTSLVQKGLGATDRTIACWGPRFWGDSRPCCIVFHGESIEGLLVVHLLGGGVWRCRTLDLTLCALDLKLYLSAHLERRYRKLKREGGRTRASDFEGEAKVVGQWAWAVGMFRHSQTGGCWKFLLAWTSSIDFMSNAANSQSLDELRPEYDSFNESLASNYNQFLPRSHTALWNLCHRKLVVSALASTEQILCAGVNQLPLTGFDTRLQIPPESGKTP